MKINLSSVAVSQKMLTKGAGLLACVLASSVFAQVEVATILYRYGYYGDGSLFALLLHQPDATSCDTIPGVLIPNRIDIPAGHPRIQEFERIFFNARRGGSIYINADACVTWGNGVSVFKTPSISTKPAGSTGYIMN
jgi:hypothetical protein